MLPVLVSPRVFCDVSAVSFQIVLSFFIFFFIFFSIVFFTAREWPTSLPDQPLPVVTAVVVVVVAAVVVVSVV